MFLVYVNMLYFDIEKVSAIYRFLQLALHLADIL